MDKDIESLKREINILNKRISILEGRDIRRRAIAKLKIIFNIITICLFIYGMWYAYDYLTNNIPKQVDKKIDSIVPSIFR